jgi:MFS family permease
LTAAFVANGLGGPSFLARIPERQEDLHLSDVGLGVVLLGFAFGALVSSPFAGRAVGRIGSRTVAVAASVALGVTLWLAGAAPSPVTLFVALTVVGAADAAMDIAMNANGAAYERRAARSALHGLHASWSLGALAAALLAGGAAALDVPLTAHLVIVGAAIAGSAAVSRWGLVADEPVPAEPAPSERAHSESAARRETSAPGESTHGGQADTERAPAAPADAHSVPAPAVDGPPVRTGRRLAGPLIVLGAATVGGAIIEGGPADWGAVRLQRFGVAEGASALAFAAFMAGMLAGRLIGDRLTDRHGARAVLRTGMALAACGVLAGVVVDDPVVFTLGLALAGFGASGFFPLAFSAAGRLPGVAPGIGAATVSLTARMGFLAEPVIVGALAEATSLRVAFLLVAVACVLLAACATTVVPEGRPAGRPAADPVP